MNTKEKIKSLTIYPLKNYYIITLLFVSLLVLVFFSIVSLILAIKSEWKIIYLFLIVAVIVKILIFRNLIWKIKGCWKIELEKNEMIIEKNFSLLKIHKKYNLDNNDKLLICNLDKIQFTENLPLGKIYLKIIEKIDKQKWSIIIENNQNEILNNLSEKQAIQILNFLENR